MKFGVNILIVSNCYNSPQTQAQAQVKRIEQNADLVGEGCTPRGRVGVGKGAVDGAALVEDEPAHGDGAQGEPEEALLRTDPRGTHKKPSRVNQSVNQSKGADAKWKRGMRIPSESTAWESGWVTCARMLIIVVAAAGETPRLLRSFLFSCTVSADLHDVWPQLRVLVIRNGALKGPRPSCFLLSPKLKLDLFCL